MRQRPQISVLRSFRVALRGFVDAVREQRNLRIHLVIAFAVIALSIWLQLSDSQCFLLALCIGNVLAMELMNTALETVVDLVSPDDHELARKAKDISASAVLVTSIMAAGIGLMLIGIPAFHRLFQIL